MTAQEVYRAMKENCRRAEELGFRRNGRIPIAVVEYPDGTATVAYHKSFSETS